MTLPSARCGDLTREVGYFETHVDRVARWLSRSLGWRWHVHPAGVATLEELAALIDRNNTLPTELTHAVIPQDGWTLFLNNGVSGTDLGVLPLHAPSELHCRVVRAVCVRGGEREFPARILEVYEDAAGESRLRRAIAAMMDGERWVFDESGEPFAFEDTSLYKRRRISDRFTAEKLMDYLTELGIPVYVEPVWREALIIARARRLNK